MLPLTNPCLSCSLQDMTNTTDTIKVDLAPLDEIINRSITATFIDHAEAVGYLQAEGAITNDEAWGRMAEMVTYGTGIGVREIRNAFFKGGGTFEGWAFKDAVAAA